MLAKMLEYSRTQERGIQEVENVVLHPYRYQCFVAASRGGMVISENLPGHEISDVDDIKEAVKRDAEISAERERLEERKRNARSRTLTQQAVLKREWSNQKEQLRKEAGEYKLKLSLSLSISAGGIARMVG